MEINMGDLLIMKSFTLRFKQVEGAPCGMDFKLKCQGCGHMVMLPRKKLKKY